MSIEGVLPYARPPALDTTATRSVAPKPLSPPEAWRENQLATAAQIPRQPSRLRGSPPGLHHRALQNPASGRASLLKVDATTTDSKLAASLEEHFHLLWPF